MEPPSLDAIERSNLRQIEALNQRGGRTLSIADLMEVGTITPEAAGYALWRIAHGASFLTGAVPGGAGKSTVLADLLAMLPPGEQIVTTPDDRAVEAASAQKDRAGNCYLCHEFGSGMWYGYLWGRAVGQFMGLSDRGGRIAGCLHADDALQTRDILVTPTLGVTAETFSDIGLLVYMSVDKNRAGASRAVHSVWAKADANGHRIAFGRDPGTDDLVAHDVDSGSIDGAPTLDDCQALMADLLVSDVRHFEEVRGEIVRFYQAQDE